MARIGPVDVSTAPDDVKAEYAQVEKDHAITNMKATLLHSPYASRAALEWYSLFSQVQPFLGKRLAILFCHAISLQNECILCTTFMRRELARSGEDPDNLVLDEREEAVVDYGRRLAADANSVTDVLFARLQKYFTPRQIVELTAFGGLMIVNNIFNSALKIDVDQNLDPFRFDPEAVFSGPSPFHAASAKESAT